jgi:type VI secretion system secreted protein VgrG
MSELPPINCSFECEGVPSPFTVIEAELTEGLSMPYALELKLRTDMMAIHPELLIGRSCTFHVDRGHVLRSVHGIVEEVEIVGDSPMSHFDDKRVVRLAIVPAFKLLEHRKNSRIFQDMTVLQIVKDVLLGETAEPGGGPEGLLAFGRSYDPAALRTTDYDPARDYCVQYKESDFAFVSRMLEEEGIAYHFDHMRINHEVMVLHDSNLTYPQIEAFHGAPFLRMCEHEALQQTEGLAELSWKRVKKTDKTLLRHWDWLTPREGSESAHSRDEGEAAAATAAGAGEVAMGAAQTSYLHSDERSREEYDGDRVRRVHGEGNRRAQLEHQREKVDEWVALGKSNALGIASGRMFEHDGDGVHSVLVTKVVHKIDASASGAGENAIYSNEFEAIPAFRAYRPKKEHKRPKIEGPQTAIVTGPEGEEIHTDSHGRIKILMHWDRDGEGGHRRQRRHDPASSVWVRVAQMLAGSGWGSWFLPRVGMEVVVQFLDGNPDRPLVTGCVYNGEHRTPYTLPEEKTKSTIKSSSSPGNAGYNELRFEDAAGSEEVWLHGQRDYNSRIERRHTMHVGENQEYTIEGDRSRTVHGSERVHVMGNQAITVDGGGQDGVKGIAVNVVESYKLSASRDIAEDAPEKIVLVCQGSMIEMTPERIVIRSGDGAEIVLDKNVLATSNDQSRLLMDDNIKAEAQKGALLHLEDKAKLQDTNGSRVELDSRITIESCDGGKSEYDDKIKSEAAEISSVVEQTQLVLKPSETELDSPSIAVRGQQNTEIEGGGGRATFSGGKASLN